MVSCFLVWVAVLCFTLAHEARAQQESEVHGQKLLTVPAPADVARPPSGARKSASGIAMKVLVPAHGAEHPMDNDCIRVRFTGWKRDGELSSTSGLHQEALVQCMNAVIPGVAAALKTMVAGEKRRIWVPANLSFIPRHHHGQGQRDLDQVPDRMDLDLKPAMSMDLTFDVELLQIIKAPPTPPDLGAAPKNAVQTSSGLAYRVLKSGTGTIHPSLASQVTLLFSGWTGDGKLLESTVISGHPAVFLVGTTLPGWREGLQRMVVGEKTRFWIPAGLAYGESPVNRMLPAGTLVYDIELLAVD